METKNFVQLCGYIVREPDSKQYASGHRVALCVATPQDPDNPNQYERGCWHDVIAWDELADKAIVEFVRGSKIEVEGRLVYHKYTGTDGVKRLAVYVKAHVLKEPEN
jgi:single stranded DNA-binding protein